MVKVKKIQRTLEDLIIINNDRIRLYEKALGELDGTDNFLGKLFNDMADQSRYLRSELQEKIKLMGEEDSTESSSIQGTLQRLELDIKKIFTGNRTKSILDACETGEDNVQNAYDHALLDREYMDDDTIHIIEWQREALKESHDVIKQYRDEQAAL